MAEMTEFMESGIPGLDHVLKGGLPRNRMYAVCGASGSGKTTMCLHFLIHGIGQGERCLYVGTSETEVEIRQVAESHGWSLEGLTIRYLRMTPDQNAGPEQTMLHPAEVELPRTVEALIGHIKEDDPQRVVIDSLSEIRLLAREENWYRRQLVALKNFLMERQCTALLTDTECKANSIVSTLVHGAIEMKRESPLYGPEKRHLMVGKLRGHDFVSGYHDYRIVRGGLRVFPRLIAAEHRTGFTNERLASGIPELDTLLGGGLDRGTSTVVDGAAGTGKSAISTQLAIAAAQRGERSLIYCFDERLQTFFGRARGLGMPIEKHVEEGTIIVRQVDPAELSAGEFSSMVVDAVTEKQVKMVIVDSLNGYVYALPDERFLSVHLHELSSFLNLKGVVTVFTLATHGGMSATGGITPFEVSYVADTVIGLRYFEFQGSIRKSISVQKKRGGDHERTIRELTMDSGGVHVGLVLKEFEGIISGLPKYVGRKLDEKEEDS
jgi:circadian clock protein KaiC